MKKYMEKRQHRWWRPGITLLAGAFACAVTLGPSSVEAAEKEAGIAAGLNWNHLTAPTDPAGEPTFMWGSAFTGFGTLLGATASMDLSEVGSYQLRLTGDLLYGYHRGAGFAEHDEQGGRIDVQFTTHVVRLPVLARIGASPGSSGPTVGAGLEPIFGVMSSAEVTTTGVEEQIQPVETTPSTGMATVLAVGYEVRLDDMTIPLDARVSWNPFVGSSTEERMEDFQSLQNPGQYKMAFDWQFMFTGAVRWGL